MISHYMNKQNSEEGDVNVNNGEKKSIFISIANMLNSLGESMSDIFDFKKLIGGYLLEKAIPTLLQNSDLKQKLLDKTVISLNEGTMKYGLSPQLTKSIFEIIEDLLDEKEIEEIMHEYNNNQSSFETFFYNKMNGYIDKIIEKMQNDGFPIENPSNIKEEIINTIKEEVVEQLKKDVEHKATYMGVQALVTAIPEFGPVISGLDRSTITAVETTIENAYGKAIGAATPVLSKFDKAVSTNAITNVTSSIGNAQQNVSNKLGSVQANVTSSIGNEHNTNVTPPLIAAGGGKKRKTYKRYYEIMNRVKSTLRAFYRTNTKRRKIRLG